MSEDELVTLSCEELTVIENCLEQKIEALGACFGVIPMGKATQAVAQHRNELMPVYAKIQELRKSCDTP